MTMPTRQTSSSVHIETATELPASPCEPPAVAAAADAGEFVRRHHRRLYAWFRSLTRDDSAAADLTQDAFTAYVACERRMNIDRPPVWLFRIARNLWKAHLRSRKRAARFSVPLGDEPPSGGHSVQNDAIGRQERIRELVLELPAALREVVVLYYWSDYSTAEIAAILSRPHPLVRWRLHYARKMLRQRLHECGLHVGGEP